MMMEATDSYETLVFIYHSTRIDVTESRNLCIQRCCITPPLYEVHMTWTQLAQNGVE
jgi:hypothetical protein